MASAAAFHARLVVWLGDQSDAVVAIVVVMAAQLNLPAPSRHWHAGIGSKMRLVSTTNEL